MKQDAINLPEAIACMGQFFDQRLELRGLGLFTLISVSALYKSCIQTWPRVQQFAALLGSLEMSDMTQVGIKSLIQYAIASVERFLD